MKYLFPEHHIKGQRQPDQCYNSLELMGAKKADHRSHRIQSTAWEGKNKSQVNINVEGEIT